MNENKFIRLDELDAGHPLRKHPFESNHVGVPDGYFDSLPSIIQNRVVKKQHGWSVSWSWQRSVASLAGFGLVVALVWVTWPARQDSLGQEALSNVSKLAITNYLDEEGISTTELAEYAPVQQSFDEDATKNQLQGINPDEIRDEIDFIPEETNNQGS